MKRKIISLISLLIILASIIPCFGVFADSEEIGETLRYLGVCPPHLTDDILDETATRSDMASIVSRLVDQSEKEAVDTVFSDVTKDNPESGYIQYAYDRNIILGTGDKKFNPDSPATADAVFVTVLRALGYGTQLSSEEITKIAEYIELTDGVYSRGNAAITNKEMLQIIHNALTVPMGRLDSFDKRLIVNENKCILSDVMGINVYKGTVTEVVQKKDILKFTVSENVYENNSVFLPEGANVSFNIKDDTLFMYENTPVYLWADKDGNVVRVYAQKKVEVSYETVYAVNRDISENSRYSINNINEIEFYGDSTRYPVSENATLIYNDKQTTMPVVITQKYVKVVKLGDEVINLESWDLTQGGIITENAGSYIEYSDRTTSGKRLRNILDNDECRVIINGKPAKYQDLKKDSVFNYYKEDEYIVIVNTETMISDVFDTYNQKEIKIGGDIYACKNTVFSDNGVDYNLSDYDKLFGLVIDAFFDETNKCVFVRKSDSDENVENGYLSKFIAVVDGCHRDSELSPRKIRLFVLEPSVSLQEFVMVNDSKMKYYDGITLSDLENNGRDYNAAGVYEFEINSNNEIKSVKKPDPYYGVQNSLTTYESLTDDFGYPTINGISDEVVTKPIAFKKSRYFVLRDENGTFNVKECAWSDIRNTVPASGTTPKLLLVGDEKKTDPKMVIICNAHNLQARNSIRYGVLESNELFYDVETESEMHEVVVNNQTYLVSKELGMSLPKRAIIKYNPVTGVATDPLDITNFINIEGTISTWLQGDGSTDMTNFLLRQETISYIDDIRVCFNSNDRGYVFYRYSGTYKYNSEKDKLVAIETDDLSVGDTVICGMTDTVKFMILVD